MGYGSTIKIPIKNHGQIVGIRPTITGAMVEGAPMAKGLGQHLRIGVAEEGRVAAQQHLGGLV